MADSYFVRLDEDATSGRYLAGPATTGPWSGDLQHGGPPNALAVAAAQRVVRAETERDDFVPLRLAAEFVGPVPVDQLETSARLVRAARSAALAEVVVSARGRDCLHVRVWFVRSADTSSVVQPLPAPVQVPVESPGLDASFGYGASLEWRFVHGRMREPGPGAVWVRPTIALLDGDEPSGLARVVLIADSASGVSAELDWTEWSFLNIDLDVHLARPFEGEWLLMDAQTQLGATGSALARSTLSDVRGIVGSGLQTLILAPMSR